MTRQLPRHIVVWLLLVLAWMGAAANGTVRLKNYDIWKDLPTKKLCEMGRRYFDYNNVDSALVCYTIVANRYYSTPRSDKEEFRRIGVALNELGVLHTHFLVDYEKANRYLLKAKKIAEEFDIPKLLGATYINLCTIHIIDDGIKGYGTVSDYTIHLQHNAFEASLTANDPMGVIISASNIAHLASASLNNDILLNDISQFLNYQLPDSMNRFQWVYDYCKAAQEMNRGNYETALSLYNQVLNHVCSTDRNKRNQEFLTHGILDDMCRLLYEMHRYQEMVDILNDFAQQSKAAGNHEQQHNAYQALANYYHEIAQDSAKGDHYELLALREKDIMLNKNKLMDARQAEFLFQIDEINAEVQELNTRQRITKIIAWSVTALVLVVLAFLYLLWRKYKQEQEKNRKLYENNLALLAAEDERRQQIIEAEQNKYQSHQMEEGEQSDLLHRVLYIMETSEEIYDNDFSLDRLTELVDARSSNYVSQVLNGHYHQSFKSVVNDYRIREACRRLNDPEHYSMFTVQGIAQSVGFSSYPNFVTNFKKFTGLTPSAYRKQGKAAPEPSSVH